MTTTAGLFDGKLFESGLFNGGIFETSAGFTVDLITVTVDSDLYSADKTI